jgi:hypothetical protein
MPNISHLKVFGSIGYVHVDDQVRTKLNDKSKKCSLWAMKKSLNDTSFTTLIKERC